MTDVNQNQQLSINTNPVDNDFFVQDDYNAIAEDELSQSEMQELFLKITNQS